MQPIDSVPHPYITPPDSPSDSSPIDSRIAQAASSAIASTSTPHQNSRKRHCSEENFSNAQTIFRFSVDSDSSTPDSQNSPQASQQKTLWLAAQEGNWPIVEEAISQGTADVNATPVEKHYAGQSVLWFAALDDKWNLVELILRNYPDAHIHAAAAEGEYEGKNLLWFAFMSREWRIIRLVLEKDSQHLRNSLNSMRAKFPDLISDTCSCAVKEMQLDIVDFLLTAFEDPSAPSAKTFEGGLFPSSIVWSDVESALRSRSRVDIDARVTEGEFEGANLIWLASHSNKWEIVALILDNCQEFDINARPKQGSYATTTVIWLAASNDKWEIVQAILHCHPEADLNIKPDGETNVLLLAATVDDFRIAAEVMGSLDLERIDFSSLNQTWNGVHIPWILAYQKKWPIVSSIIKKYPSINGNAQMINHWFRRGSGETLAWLLAAHGKWDLLELIVQHNSELNILAAPLDPSLSRDSLLTLTLRGNVGLAKLMLRKQVENFGYLECGGSWFILRSRDVEYFAELFQSYLTEEPHLNEDVIRAIAEYAFTKTDPPLTQRDPLFVPTFSVRAHVEKKLRDRMVLIASSATEGRGLSEEGRRELFRTIFSELKKFLNQTFFPKDLRDGITQRLRSLDNPTPDLIERAIRSASSLSN